MEGMVVQEKVGYIRGLLKQDSGMRATDIYVAVKGKFGTGVDGNTVRKLKQEADPSYTGKRKKTTRRFFPEALDGIKGFQKDIDAKKKVKALEAVKSFMKAGATASQAQAAYLDMTRKRPLVYDLTKEQQEKIIDDLTKYGRACLALNKKGEVVRINPTMVTIQENRGRKKKDSRELQQN